MSITMEQLRNVPIALLREELERREVPARCAEDGHKVESYVANPDQTPIVGYCECGLYKWTPERGV
jgi:hypothetical protein